MHGQLFLELIYHTTFVLWPSVDSSVLKSHELLIDLIESARCLLKIGTDLRWLDSFDELGGIVADKMEETRGIGKHEEYADRGHEGRGVSNQQTQQRRGCTNTYVYRTQ